MKLEEGQTYTNTELEAICWYQFWNPKQVYEESSCIAFRI